MIFDKASCFAQTISPNSLLSRNKQAFFAGNKKQHVLHALHVSNTYTLSKPILRPDYYINTLGFFCKQEWKFEKITKVPFRFRLGSMVACDWLEGKPNAAASFRR